MTFNLTQKVCLLTSESDFLSLVRNVIVAIWSEENPTVLRCVEEAEMFFGVQLGTDEQAETGEVKLYDAIYIKDKERSPKSFPCLFLTYSMRGLEYGSSNVAYSDEPEYVYLSDFK